MSGDVCACACVRDGDASWISPENEVIGTNKRIPGISVPYLPALEAHLSSI